MRRWEEQLVTHEDWEIITRALMRGQMAVLHGMVMAERVEDEKLRVRSQAGYTHNTRGRWQPLAYSCPECGVKAGAPCRK